MQDAERQPFVFCQKTVLPSIPGSSFSLDGCLQGIDAAEHTDLQSQVILKIWRGEADVDDLLMKMVRSVCSIIGDLCHQTANVIYAIYL